MIAIPAPARRARPLLGTLVEIGADCPAAHEAAFAAIARVQARMSRFDAHSDIGRFNALPAGAAIEVDAWTAEVLGAAQRLQASTDGAFDVSLGSARAGWRCEATWLYKLDDACRLDLGGIAKGFAVDRAVDALRAAGATRGWVNAGGDLRVFGELEVPLMLRDENEGGVRAFGRLADGACATSDLRRDGRAHVSVLAAQCLWADALTKVAAHAGIAGTPQVASLLAAHGAQAWWH
jgi:thiamine biosynthesis lipoprotein